MKERADVKMRFEGDGPVSLTNRRPEWKNEAILDNLAGSDWVLPSKETRGSHDLQANENLGLQP